MFIQCVPGKTIRPHWYLVGVISSENTSPYLHSKVTE